MLKLNDYQCERTGDIFEKMARVTDKVTCKCGSPMRKVMSAPKVVIPKHMQAAP